MSGWTWERFTLPQFAEIQAARGRASGKARREAVAERNQHIHELRAAGYTQVLIARVVGVSRKTVGRVIHNGTHPNNGTRTISG